MSVSAVIAAYNTKVADLKSKLVAEGSSPSAAHRAAINACRCYWSPPFDVELVPDDAELARKILADDPLDEEEELDRLSWDLAVDFCRVAGE